MGSRLHSAPNLSDLHSCRQKITKQYSDPLVAHFSHVPAGQPAPPCGLPACRSLRSSPKLSEFMQRSPLPTIMGSPTKVSQSLGGGIWFVVCFVCLLYIVLAVRCDYNCGDSCLTRISRPSTECSMIVQTSERSKAKSCVFPNCAIVHFFGKDQ